MKFLPIEFSYSCISFSYRTTKKGTYFWFYIFRVDEIFHQPYFFSIQKANIRYIKIAKPNTKDDDHMNNILELRYKSKIKNIIWDNKVQEKIFKRENLYFIQLHIRKPEFCTVCGCVSQNYNIVKNGTKTSRITLCSVSGLPAYLNLRKQRFL